MDCLAHQFWIGAPSGKDIKQKAPFLHAFQRLA
jgi:hypothetical protein